MGVPGDSYGVPFWLLIMGDHILPNRIMHRSLQVY